MLLKGFEIKPENDFLDSRKVLLFNNDVWFGLAAPKKSLRTYFYKNADADEMLVKAQLASKIGEILKRRKLKQEQAAEILGIPQHKLSETPNSRSIEIRRSFPQNRVGLDRPGRDAASTGRSHS